MVGLGLDHFVHEVSLGGAVESSGEHGVGDVLLFDFLGYGRVRRLVVWRRRHVDGVVVEVDAAYFAVEVVSGVVDIAAGVGSSGECDCVGNVRSWWIVGIGVV